MSEPLQSLLLVLIGTYLLARSPAGDGGQPAGRHQPKQMVNIRISKTSNFRVSKYPSLMIYAIWFISHCAGLMS
jgi:hypothetical protein